MAEINASFSLKGWNENQLRNRIGPIMRAYGDVLGPQLKREIKTVQFYWPRDTYRTGALRAAKTVKASLKIYQAQGRRAGYWVSSPRDIVDSGAFLRSQRTEYPSSSLVQITWDPVSEDGFRYAGLILKGNRTGFVTSRGAVMPPRDWITPALTKLPLDRFFAAEWRRLAGAGR